MHEGFRELEDAEDIPRRAEESGRREEGSPAGLGKGCETQGPILSGLQAPALRSGLRSSL